MIANQAAPLSDLVEAMRDEIIERWLVRVRQRVTHDEVARPELVDTMPGFLCGMAASLRGHGSIAEPETPSGEVSIAGLHGAQRYRLGFDINAVMQEYGFLREVVFDLLEASGQPHSLSELRVFTRLISEGIAEAVSHFASERDRDLREQERLRATVEKERSDFERQLIGIVSHDLKSPLTVIRMDSTLLLRRANLDEQGVKSARRIINNAERATRLINDLLDFTQVRFTGAIPVSVRSTDLRAIVRGVVEETRLAAPHRELRADLDGELLGEWDPDRLAQVVTNLVNNALKYSPADTPVSVVLDAQPRSVEVTVHNEGTAIAPELLSRLFRPLERGAAGPDAREHSVGLGLFIVEQIVQAHGGVIDVESTEERGTTFTVRLPRCASRAREEVATA